LKTEKRKTLKWQLNKLLIIAVAPFLLMTVILITLLVSFNLSNAEVLRNAMTATEFNAEFKHNIDRPMYYYVIRGKNTAELPLTEVERAEELLNRLRKTTTGTDNLWRIQSMLNMLGNLKKYMFVIEKTKLYDDRIRILEKDIYLITQLIERYMHDYIYHEVAELSRLHTRLSRDIFRVILLSPFATALLLFFVVRYALRFTRRIAEDISQLAAKIQLAGGGDFAKSAINTEITEIMTLDEGFNDMGSRLRTLMEKERENQVALRKAEFELLQSQINPHFLYNTLDSIVWLAESERNRDVVTMTSLLSDFFRGSLSGGREIITIEAEKNQVSSYLDIQKIRYSDILEYTIDIPPELYGYEIPKLTLQPLVENAIYHGIKQKRSLGKIAISAGEEGTDILIKVWNNGSAMSPEQVETFGRGVFTGHTGLGLKNVDKRLKLYCGDSYGLSFRSDADEGTTITVTIPKKIEHQSQKKTTKPLKKQKSFNKVQKNINLLS
jgi:two-component system sensor histidine kinase YesM